MDGIRRARMYWQAIPPILACQLVTKFVLALVLWCLRRLAAWALASQGRVAVTSGDWTFLFTSWQGWTLLLTGVVTLYVYVAIDLNVKVALSGHVVRGERASLGQTMTEGISSIRHFLCLDGIATVLYVSLLAPIVGVGLGISLTDGLQIPTFISSVIKATPLYHVAYVVTLAIFALVGFFGIFCIHGVVLSREGVREALTHSQQIMRAHWRDFLLKMLLFGLRMGLVVMLATLACIAAPAMLVLNGIETVAIMRFWTLLLCLLTLSIASLVGLLGTPFVIIKMTQLYLGYRGEKPHAAPAPPLHAPGVSYLVATLGFCIFVGCVGLAALGDAYFDELFPAETSVRVIAHRGGGNEGPENTVAGLKAAAALGAWGSEIDIQRTSDGAYVVNHDKTFKRTAGDRRKPGKMTLAEVRELSVDGEPVATYEEMLDAAHETGVVLFVELKGPSADQQMADDAVRIATERGMLDECVFISLDYRLIDYLEGAYPEAQTGFLAWASYGDTTALNCDYLALEELSSTSDAIAATHEQGKQLFVWTVNDRDSQRHFLYTKADAIITDNVSQANEVRAELEARSDTERVFDTVLTWI